MASGGTIALAHRIDRPFSHNKKAPPKAQSNQSKLDEKAYATRNASDARPQTGMLVSLDHTIYFHDPHGFRADEWIFAEQESPWAGDSRGLATQRIYTRDGKLIASCFQEVSLAAIEESRWFDLYY